MSGHMVTYTSAHNMFRQLRSSRVDPSFDRTMLRYTKPDLLIINDLGLQPLKQDEPQDLYEVMRHRYEHGALVITSNRSTAEWYPLFGEALLASAAMDRLLHHCHIVERNGDAYRNPKDIDNQVAETSRALALPSNELAWQPIEEQHDRDD